MSEIYATSIKQAPLVAAAGGGPSAADGGVVAPLSTLSLASQLGASPPNSRSRDPPDSRFIVLASGPADFYDTLPSVTFSRHVSQEKSSA